MRSFFAQGGRKCYVVRVGDPWPYTAGRDHRARQLSRLAPGFPTHTASTPVDRNTWRGVGHLFGLPDISFICLPDLCDAVRVEPVTEAPQVELPPPPEQFVECSDGEAPPPPDQTARLLVAPRSDEAGYDLWAQLLAWVARLLAQHRREVQLVAAVPLPHSPAGPSGAGAAPYRDLLEFLTRADVGPLAYRLGERTTGTASAFVQLVYPWIRTPGSTNLPEGLESPDAALTGILAQNALTRGTYRSVAGLPLGDIYEVLPVLRQDQMLRSRPDRPEATAASHNLMERVSLLGPTPGGLAVLSDVTATLGESYRPAGVNRLVASVLRAARRFGEDVVFESSGQRMWARLREQMVNLLLQLHRSGALRGATPAEAFSVRCDRTTMTQADIDAGRVIARIILNPASPIEQITVTLALEDGGLVSLASDQ